MVKKLIAFRFRKFIACHSVPSQRPVVCKNSRTRVLMYEICRDIMKERHQKDLFAKNNHSGANCFEITGDSIQILLNLTQFIALGTESNLEGFAWSHQRKTGLVPPIQFAPR